MVEADKPEGFRRVAAALAVRGHAHAPVWLEVAARTSQEAADVGSVPHNDQNRDRDAKRGKAPRF